ncbi:hypothetical protein A5670_05780 [Mycolicibacterium fortuitum]|nr:hypothetical protein A5670_05780 [Mycolicibacterium fortuitum]
MGRAGRGLVGPAIRVDQAARAGPIVPAAPVGKATTAAPVTGARAGPAGLAGLAGLDGRVSTVGPTTAAGNGALHRRIWPGAESIRAGSTTSRSTTTAAG